MIQEALEWQIIRVSSVPFKASVSQRELIQISQLHEKLENESFLSSKLYFERGNQRINKGSLFRL